MCFWAYSWVDIPAAFALRVRAPGCFTAPEGTYLAWLDARGLSSRRFAGVSLVDGADCGAPGFLRLNFATTRALLSEILDRISPETVD